MSSQNTAFITTSEDTAIITWHEFHGSSFNKENWSTLLILTAWPYDIISDSDMDTEQVQESWDYRWKQKPNCFVCCCGWHLAVRPHNSSLLLAYGVKIWKVQAWHTPYAHMADAEIMKQDALWLTPSRIMLAMGEHISGLRWGMPTLNNRRKLQLLNLK